MRITCYVLRGTGRNPVIGGAEAVMESASRNSHDGLARSRSFGPRGLLASPRLLSLPPRRLKSQYLQCEILAFGLFKHLFDRNGQDLQEAILELTKGAIVTLIPFRFLRSHKETGNPRGKSV